MSTARVSFVGRERESARLAELVRTAPVVTLCGPGGVGKTTLAARVCEQLAGEFADGVCWCDLARVDAGESVAVVVAAALGGRNVALEAAEAELPALAAGRAAGRARQLRARAGGGGRGRRAARRRVRRAGARHQPRVARRRRRARGGAGGARAAERRRPGRGPRGAGHAPVRRRAAWCWRRAATRMPGLRWRSARALAEEAGAQHLEAWATYVLGMIALGWASTERARRDLETSLRLARARSTTRWSSAAACASSA